MCCGSTGKKEVSISEAGTFELGLMGCIGVGQVEQAFQSEGTAHAKAQKQVDQRGWEMRQCLEPNYEGIWMPSCGTDTT